MQDFSSHDEQWWDDPFEIDTSVAHPARRYDYWLGGKVNFEADRKSGDAVAAAFPTAPLAAQENRRFLRRAVTYLVNEAGIRQFLDIGTGIPSADNVHEVAQSIAPESRVAYADNDPIVLAHARRLLSGTADGATTYLQADLRRPHMILGHPDLRKTLDLSQPTALILIAVAQSVPDTDNPYDHVATLAEALAPGSYLVMSHGTTDFVSAEERATALAVLERDGAHSRDPHCPRDRAAFARFFEGMELVPPGIVALPEWRSDRRADGPDSTVAGIPFYAAVARIR
jgi:hypothetical protein